MCLLHVHSWMTTIQAYPFNTHKWIPLEKVGFHVRPLTHYSHGTHLNVRGFHVRSGTTTHYYGGITYIMPTVRLVVGLAK